MNISYGREMGSSASDLEDLVGPSTIACERDRVGKQQHATCGYAIAFPDEHVRLGFRLRWSVDMEEKRNKYQQTAGLYFVESWYFW